MDQRIQQRGQAHGPFGLVPSDAEVQQEHLLLRAILEDVPDQRDDNPAGQRAHGQKQGDEHDRQQRGGNSPHGP